MKARWPAFVLAPLMLAAVWGALRPPRQVIELTTRFQDAELGPLLAPRDPLATFEAGPFLGLGWASAALPVAGVEHYRRTIGPRGQLRFYAKDVIPVDLVVTGRPAGPQTVNCTLNNGPPHLLTIDPEHPDIHYSAEVSELKEGVNVFQMLGARRTEWKDFRVYPRSAPRRLAREATLKPEIDVAQTAIRIPFTQSLEVPLEVGPRSSLVLDGLQAWTEPGAPGLAQPWELVVRMRAGSPPTDRTWQLHGTGRRSLRLSLPDYQPVALTLLARCPAAPQPGQLGVQLQNLHLDSWTEEPPDERPPEPTAPRGPTRKCNVIVYLIDTLRADHLGCYGYSFKTSPRIDAFARDSVLFLNATAQSSWTKAATASVLTSLLPRDHQALDFGDKLRDSAVTLTEVLHKAGYATRGWVTNPFVSQPFGFSRGFDEFDLMAGKESHLVNAELLPWLRRQNPDNPFFVYVHTLDPHTPYAPPPRFLRRPIPGVAEDAVQKIIQDAFWARTLDRPNPTVTARMASCLELYDGEIACNDDSFGAMIDTLKKQGMYDDTLIVLLSDHGEEFLEHGGVGHITTLYQELLHIPMIIKFPQNRAAGTRIRPTWQQVDLAPTILAELGLPQPPEWCGKPYRPGGTVGEERRPAFFTLVAGKDAARFGQGNKPRFVSLDGVRVGTWVFNRAHASNGFGNIHPEELYNLESDPHENANVAYLRPEVRLKLSALLRSKFPKLAEELADKAPAQDVERAMRGLQYLR